MKKVILIIMFVVITGVLIALVPVEQKRELKEKYGVLVDDAETDERAAFILEHAEEYPENFLDYYYGEDENFDFVYNYLAHKNDYSIMSFTEGELNSESVPKLYMDDTRWCYETIYGSYIKTLGCVPVCLTMASLAVNRDSSLDPVLISRIAEENFEEPFSGGVEVSYIGALAEKSGFTVTEHKLGDDGIIVDEQLITQSLDDGNVLIVAMVGYTFGNHAIVIRDITDDGLLINDPASEENSEKVWKLEEIQSEIYGLWSLSK